MLKLADVLRNLYTSRVNNSWSSHPKMLLEKVFWKYTQVYRRTPMSNCNFNNLLATLYWNCTSAWARHHGVFCCKFAANFQNSVFSEYFWTVPFVTREVVRFRAQNFQGIVFIWTQTYTGVFKSALVYYGGIEVG